MKIDILREKPVPLPLHPPQIPYGKMLIGKPEWRKTGK